MKILDKSVVEFMGLCPDELPETLKHIEKAGRICYNSEDKITEDSAPSFCKKLCDRGHTAMVEHSWFGIKVLDENHPLLQPFLEDNYLIVSREEDEPMYIVGNYRAWVNAYIRCFDSRIRFNALMVSIQELLEVWFGGDIKIVPNSQLPKHLQASTFKFKTDRSVTHELVRHRPASFAQQSQRYVASRNHVEFLKPWWVDVDNHLVWEQSMVHIEDTYHALLRDHSPQEARVVLPNCATTEIIITTYGKEWGWIFELRTAAGAYSPMREMMKEAEAIYKGVK